MAKQSVQSIEPNIADLANGWLKQYKLPYKLEQESINNEIDKALSDYFTKNGGVGANRPDAKILLQDKHLNWYPILIEYKGYKDKLVKLDEAGRVENRTAKNEPNLKNINSFAVNGAVHYANALLHHTSYTDIIAIGMTGYKDEAGKVIHQIGVYYVSKENFGAGDDTGVYFSLSKKYSERTMLYFTTAMSQAVKGKFDFGKKLRSSQSLKFKTILPTRNAQPDYASMEHLICAIQKLVIKDVVSYTNNKLNS